MMKSNATTGMDPSQEAIQKSMSQIMPLMIIGMFVFIPIPAGVLLYLVTSNIIQVLQTIIIDKQIAKENITNSKIIDAKISENN